MGVEGVELGHEEGLGVRDGGVDPGGYSQKNWVGVCGPLP